MLGCLRIRSQRDFLVLAVFFLFFLCARENVPESVDGMYLAGIVGIMWHFVVDVMVAVDCILLYPHVQVLLSKLSLTFSL